MSYEGEISSIKYKLRNRVPQAQPKSQAMNKCDKKIEREKQSNSSFHKTPRTNKNKDVKFLDEKQVLIIETVSFS
jgi:hypothetical protein